MPAGISAYTALANVTLGSNATTVTFSSISQSFRDLVLVGQVQHNSGASPLFGRINGLSTGIYQTVRMSGDGSSTSSSATGLVSSLDFAVGNNLIGTSLNNIFTIQYMDYSATNKQKSILVRAGRDDFMVMATAGRAADTNAITSLNLFINGQFVAGSTFSLYGVSV